MIKILVTGANGQLGQCLKDAFLAYPEFEMVFATRNDLDIASKSSIDKIFSQHTFDYCINTAAYTNVEKAESESDAAFAINAYGVKDLSEACKKSNTTLFHISTDYVFDGESSIPYKETDKTNPINVYGASKLEGEVFIQEICDKYFIIRTSWLYSQYGHNFLNSVLNWAKEGRSLSITTEQTGTPTNANDLANCLVQIIKSNSKDYGLYHFSNEGEATWYDFAKKILEYSNLEKTTLAKTNHYRTFARRPKYSILDNTKTNKNLAIKNRDWTRSLQSLIKNTVSNL
ncbi:dTDP-4-dehydrorhamnose reductase [Ulvibacter antarcticus]|uniref:dTDP-4-dehydrorhamnose reductase n=1 Tax=Ulvibacter antarcticus TaxID=442714 RepID=A0A3L9Z6U6_9FLAO|nr:dTDP-4-dehydrorhamnose reductase [Ulvibacter antarcticus]RMA65995.1 dTDP-4-dehydrorhamnose reductase [Ulvibacter antarcticus]